MNLATSEYNSEHECNKHYRHLGMSPSSVQKKKKLITLLWFRQSRILDCHHNSQINKVCVKDKKTMPNGTLRPAFATPLINEGTHD